MSLIFHHAQQPHGGHWFPDPTGYVIRSKTLEGLVKAVLAYRKSNGMPHGSPAAEVERFYAKQFPWLVNGQTSTTERPAEGPGRWINQLWRLPPKRWASNLGQRSRMDRCRECQHFSPLPKIDQEDMRRLIAIGGGRQDSDVGYCSAHGWVCGLAAWIESPETPREAEGCWVERPGLR